MTAFRRVEGSQAGPDALGILIPPGGKTVVLLRPRALDWDLLPLAPLPMTGAGSPFWEVGRADADNLARRVAQALESGVGRVEPIAASDGVGYEVRVAVGAFVLVACTRDPGRPYRPYPFESVAEAQDAAERLTAYLFPPADAERELYVNSRSFALPRQDA